MADTDSEQVSVELSSDEARLVVAALRQFEPYWPSDMDDLDRIELLAEIRAAIVRVSSQLSTPTSA